MAVAREDEEGEVVEVIEDAPNRRLAPKQPNQLLLLLHPPKPLSPDRRRCRFCHALLSALSAQAQLLSALFLPKSTRKSLGLLVMPTPSANSAVLTTHCAATIIISKAVNAFTAAPVSVMSAPATALTGSAVYAAAAEHPQPRRKPPTLTMELRRGIVMVFS